MPCLLIISPHKRRKNIIDLHVKVSLVNTIFFLCSLTCFRYLSLPTVQTFAAAIALYVLTFYLEIGDHIDKCPFENGILSILASNLKFNVELLYYTNILGTNKRWNKWENVYMNLYNPCIMWTVLLLGTHAHTYIAAIKLWTAAITYESPIHLRYS